MGVVDGRLQREEFRRFLLGGHVTGEGEAAMKLINFLDNLKKDGPLAPPCAWEEHRVRIERQGKEQGFGFAVSGEGEHLTIEDVVIGGQAQGKLRVGDQILEANSVHLDSLSYAEAIETLRE